MWACVSRWRVKNSWLTCTVHTSMKQIHGVLGVHDSGVQPRYKGCEGRRRRPMALRVGRGEQRWVVVDGFHGGGLALENELGIHVGHAKNTVMLRRVSMTTCCSPLASHPRSSRSNILQHVSSMLMMHAAAIGDASIVQCPLNFCWHSSRSVRVAASGHSFPSSPLGFLKEYPSDRMNRRVWRSEKRY